MNLQCSFVSRLNGKLSCFTWLAVPNAMHSDCEWRLRTIQRRLLFIYFLCTHTHPHTYLDTQGHSCIGQREGGLQHAGISTWYWQLINIAECCSFLALNAVLPSLHSLPPSTISIGRLTTLSANVKCSCSGPGSQ